MIFFFFEKVLKCFRLALHPHPTQVCPYTGKHAHTDIHITYIHRARERLIIVIKIYQAETTKYIQKLEYSVRHQICSEGITIMKKNFARQWKRIEGPGATKRLKQQSTLVDIRNVLKVANTGYPGNCESTSGTYAQQCNLFYNYESFLAECHLCVILCKHVPETGGHCLHQSKECFVFSFPGFPYFPTPPDFQLHPHPPPSLPTPTPASELWPHSRVQGEEAAALC